MTEHERDERDLKILDGVGGGVQQRGTSRAVQCQSVLRLPPAQGMGGGW